MSLALILLAFGFVSFFKGLLMFVFLLCGLVLVLVILLQEPKGGGLSAAFGGAGAETFGVQTGGINRFTAYVSATWIITAILFAAIRPDEEVAHTDATRVEAPEMPAVPGMPGGAVATPADASGQGAGGTDMGGTDTGGQDAGGKKEEGK